MLNGVLATEEESRRWEETGYCRRSKKDLMKWMPRDLMGYVIVLGGIDGQR